MFEHLDPYRHQDPTKHDWRYPPLSWASEPACEILVYMAAGTHAMNAAVVAAVPGQPNTL